MLKKDTREIGGKKYEIVSLASVPGRTMLVRLFKLMGPAMSAALKAADTGEGFSLKNLTAGAIADAITDLCARLTEAEFLTISDVFLDNTYVWNPESGGYAPLQKTFAFNCDYGNLFKLLAFHVEHNFSSFLEGLGLTKHPA